MLLVASCYFYMAFTPYYIFLIMAAIIVDYIIGILIETCREQGKSNTKLLLGIGFFFPLLILFVFKYYNFFNQSIIDIAKFLNLNYSPNILNLILPVGISFYTFQTLGYVIDVYRGNQKAERHLGIFSVYVMFFPQLVAGPIERSRNLLQQFYEKHSFDYKRVTDGLKLMAWGFFKKMVIADRIAVVVNEVYNNPGNYTGIHFIIATIFFTYQVYCDFSGYSDIAIGAAQVMGFRLMENFQRPYFAKSIQEYWRRWHISLTSWFRDYVYIPLGGNRVVRWRWYFNVYVVFLITGLWHGANWTFIIWGALHGLYSLFSIMTRNIRARATRFISIDRVPMIKKIWQVGATFSLVNFGFILFRSNSISDAYYIITHLFSGIDKLFYAIMSFDYQMIKKLVIVTDTNALGIKPSKLFLPEMFIAILAIIIMESVHLIQRKGSVRYLLSQKSAFLRWSIYYLLLLSIIFFGINTQNPFIYFQF
ncbi:MAG: MBOAT family O-acyltransferase [Spirochaetota bacterium]|nr:MBOAT family O-acyltransferase [Spirochaetota bacterium]